MYHTPVTAPHFKILENYYTLTTAPTCCCSPVTSEHRTFCHVLKANCLCKLYTEMPMTHSILHNGNRSTVKSSCGLPCWQYRCTVYSEEQTWTKWWKLREKQEKLWWKAWQTVGCIFLKQAMQKWKRGQSRWQALNIKMVVAKTSCVSKQLSLQQRHFGWGSVSMRVGCSLRDGELVPECDMRVQGRGLQAEPKTSEHKTSKENSTWKFITFFHR